MKKTLSTIITIAFCLNLSGQQITQQFNMKNLLLLLIFFSLLSCGNQNAMQSETSDTIIVIYDKGETDYPIFVSYKDRMQNIDRIPTDTLVSISHKDFNKLKKLIIYPQIKEDSANCDVRMILNVNSNYLFIGTFNSACNEKNENVDLSLESIYFINSIIGRYNYICYEDLIHLEEIKKYGIPSNYLENKKYNPKRKSPRIKMQIIKSK